VLKYKFHFNIIERIVYELLLEFSLFIAFNHKFRFLMS
jgi:hypothetical protein